MQVPKNVCFFKLLAHPTSKISNIYTHTHRNISTSIITLTIFSLSWTFKKSGTCEQICWNSYCEKKKSEPKSDLSTLETGNLQHINDFSNSLDLCSEIPIWVPRFKEKHFYPRERNEGFFLRWNWSRDRSNMTWFECK